MQIPGSSGFFVARHLTVLAIAAWVAFPLNACTDAEEAGPSARATPEIAQETVRRVEELRAPGGPDRLALSAVEVASVIRFTAPDVMPEGVEPPEIQLSGGTVHLSMRVMPSAVPPIPELRRILGILPDTLSVEVEGGIVPHRSEGSALVAHRIRAAGIPLPGSLIPRILDAVGREDRPGLPPNAYLLPLPQGLRSAYILGDSLILLADSLILDAAR